MLPFLGSVIDKTYQKEGESVVDVVCRLCTTILALPFPSLYNQVINILVTSYVKTGYPSPLKALAVSLSTLIKPPQKSASPKISAISSSTLAAFEQVLTQVASFTLNNLKSLSFPTLGTFFWMMTWATQMQPPFHSLLPALPHVANACIVSLPHMLDDPLSANYATGFLVLISTHQSFSADQLGAIREKLVELVFACLARIQEPGVARPLGDLLFNIMTNPQQGVATRTQVPDAVRRCPVFARFSDEERSRIAKVVLSTAPRPRFKAMWADLFVIISSETDLDALLAYEF